MPIKESIKVASLSIRVSETVNSMIVKENRKETQTENEELDNFFKQAVMKLTKEVEIKNETLKS